MNEGQEPSDGFDEYLMVIAEAVDLLRQKLVTGIEEEKNRANVLAAVAGAAGLIAIGWLNRPRPITLPALPVWPSPVPPAH